MQTSNDCVYCHKEIIGNDFHTWAGLKWHTNHFHCSVCDRNLEGEKFFFHEGQLFCVHDYFSVFTCAACGEQIFGPMAEALGRRYHTSCFCCSVCGETIDGAFHMDEKGNLFCKPDWLIHNKLICARCGELIPGEYVTMGQSNYHPKCLTCQECGQSLAGREYVNSNDKLYCASHFRCAVCNGLLDNQVVVALGKKFHVNHFNCAGCKKGLYGEPFYEKNQSPWCGSCYEKLN